MASLFGVEGPFSPSRPAHGLQKEYLTYITWVNMKIIQQGVWAMSYEGKEFLSHYLL